MAERGCEAKVKRLYFFPVTVHRDYTVSLKNRILLKLRYFQN